jgi:hypothetical protein
MTAPPPNLPLNPGPLNAAVPLPWAPPIQPAQGPKWPTITAIAQLQQGGPRACSWRESGPGADYRSDGWQDYTMTPNATSPNLIGVRNVVFVFQRHSGSGPNAVDAFNYFAANALVGARFHASYRRNKQGLQGRTVIILMTRHNHSAAVPMPAQAASVGQASWPMFVETMDRLEAIRTMPAAQLPGGQHLIQPDLYFVSRSISSLTCLPGMPGWGSFLNAFPAWQNNIQLVYQVRMNWPHPDIQPQGQYAVPWNPDTVFNIKWVDFSLRAYITQGGPQWIATILQWQNEEWGARTMQLVPWLGSHIKYTRGNGRLQI